MKRFLSTLALLSFSSATAPYAETEAAQEEIVRPGDEDGSAMPSDGIAECAAILVAGSSKSTNIVYRNNMRHSSADWLAASRDLAVEEGSDLPADEIWDAKVSDWSERIGSVDAMRQHDDWMVYCADMGKKHGLDYEFFPVEDQNPSQ